ncbi:hypothetical protein EF908_27455 [Streptomyces sp. WAC04770]|nr:hypothetical protein [Streptomyces sp. WAC04770]RST20443.1 hypothetical protein EF908_27455 [Streptomyces sp. WAC04770]
MCATESQEAVADDPNETNNLTVIPEAPSAAKRNRPASPDMVAEPHALHGPFEAARSLAHHACAEKAVVSADRLTAAAAEDEEILKGGSRSPLGGVFK